MRVAVSRLRHCPEEIDAGKLSPDQGPQVNNREGPPVAVGTVSHNCSTEPNSKNQKEHTTENLSSQQATLLATHEAVTKPTVWTNRLRKR